MKSKLIASASALFFIGTLGIGEVFAFGVPGGGKLPGLGGGGGVVKLHLEAEKLVQQNKNGHAINY